MACVPSGRITCGERFLGSFLHRVVRHYHGLQLGLRFPFNYVFGTRLCHKLPMIAFLRFAARLSTAL